MQLLSSFWSRSIVLVAAITVTVFVAARSDAPPLDPKLELAIPAEPIPPSVPDCGTWPYDLHLRDAMQTCSTWARLDMNERWLFSVEATVIDHRMVDMTLTSIDHECDRCLDRELAGREEHVRETLDAVTQCMREELSAVTFDDDSCRFETGWSIQSDW
jgi:hypothetical protein